MSDDSGTDPKAAAAALSGAGMDASMVSGFKGAMDRRDAARKEADTATADTVKEFDHQAAERAQVAKEHPFPQLNLKPWTEKPPEVDPARSFGSMASMLGILFSAFTRQPLTSALNASASAMKAIRSTDLEQYQEARQAWKDNTELAMKNAEWEYKGYEAAMGALATDQAAGLAKYRTIAAAAQNKATMAAADAGDYVTMGQHLVAMKNSLATAGREQTRFDADMKDRGDRLALADEEARKVAKDQGMDYDKMASDAKTDPKGRPAQQLAALREQGKIAVEAREAAAKRAGTAHGLVSQDGSPLTQDPQTGAWVKQTPGGLVAATVDDLKGAFTPGKTAGGKETISMVQAQAVRELIAKTPGLSILDAMKQVKQGTQSTPRSPRAMILQSWKEEHPNATADELTAANATVGEREKAYKDFGSGPKGDQIRSFNTAVSHLDVLSEIKGALDSGDIPKANLLSNMIGKELGHPEIQSYEAVKQIVADEIFKSVVSGAGTGAERQLTASVLDAADSPRAYKAVVAGMTHLMGGQLTELDRQFKRSTGIKGGIANSDFLSESAQAAFREYQTKHGHDEGGPAAPGGAPDFSHLWGK